MWKVYGITNCDSVKKAVDLFKKNNIPFYFHDLKRDGIDVITLNEWVKKAGLEKMINKKSTTWRNLPQDVKEKMDNKKRAVTIMQQQNTIIKRPVLEKDNELFFGLDEQFYLKYLSK